MKRIIPVLIILASVFMCFYVKAQNKNTDGKETSIPTIESETLDRYTEIPLKPIPTLKNEPSIEIETVTQPDTEDYNDQKTPTTASRYAEMEKEILRLLNEHRKEAGVNPLEMDYTYYICAETRAKECLDVWSHTRPDGRKYYTVYYDYGMVDGIKLIGENLARNFKSLESIVEMLMESTAHRKNILLPDYTHVTISIVPVKGYEGLYSMAQLFIKKD